METHHANCHCGLIQFTFLYPPLPTAKLNRCNCSICTKNGYLLAYPLRKDVIFRSGEAELSQYRFGNMVKPHKFCPRCGTSILIDFGESGMGREREFLAVNIRTVERIEDVIDSLEFRAVDGKNRLEPPYSFEKV